LPFYFSIYGIGFAVYQLQEKVNQKDLYALCGKVAKTTKHTKSNSLLLGYLLFVYHKPLFIDSCIFLYGY
jgi:hypothetical protein